VAIGLGLVIGAETLIGQGRLPGAWQHLANTGGPWLVGAFFIGAFMPSQRLAATAGLATLFGCLLGYYVAAHILVDASADSGTVVFWIGAALVGGPLFGLAGHWWRAADARDADARDADTSGWRDAPVWGQRWGRWRRAVGAGLLGAVIVAEGLFLLQVVPAEDRAA
jgi:hypothetical protein